MKKLFLGIGIVLPLLFSFNSDNQDGIRFNADNWNQAKKIAKVKGKPIFVFIYGTYCLLSRDMATKTFTRPNVIKCFNRNFVCVKMNSGNVKNHVKMSNWGILKIPSIVFFTPAGKNIVYQSTGLKDEEEMIHAAKSAMSALKEH